MWAVIRNHPVAVFFAVLAHVVFLVLLFVSFDFTEKSKLAGTDKPQMEIINATAVDEKKIQKRLDDIKAAERKKQEAARKAREAKLREKRRQAQLKKKRAEEQQRKAEAKKRKQREAAEKKRLAELEKKRKEKQRKQREAELKKKQELARKQEEQRKRQEKEERKRQEELKRQEEIKRQEQELAAKLRAEQEARAAAARQAALQKKTGEYRARIKNEVIRHWNMPSGSSDTLKTVVKVRIIPGGDVVDVQIINSSGDPAFDQSVEKAVYRAAPLPVPPIESGLFDHFREVIFKFAPHNRGRRDK